MKYMNSSFILILIKLFNFIFSECCKSSPYSKLDKCVTYTECSKEQLLKGECQIDNPIIKIQYLTNIIKVGDLNFRYINSATNSNGDIILLISSNPPSCVRKFYGLKNNGRFYFNNKGFESQFFSFNINGEENDDQRKYEGEILFIELSNNNNNINNKEYLLSIAKWEAYTELFDFTEGDYNFMKSSEFFQSYIYSLKNSFFKLNQKDDGINYYIFASITKPINEPFGDQFYFYIKKFSFSKKKIAENGYTINSNNYIEGPKGKIISCFESNKSFILCFFQNKNYNFVAIIYDQNLNQLSSEIIILSGNSIDQNENIFIKCIHYREEIGVFSFYQSYTTSYPTISFKNIENQTSLIDYNNFKNIILNKVVSNPNLMYNDIIKLDDYEICFFSVNQEREVFNVILIKEYNSHLSIKYYSVDCYLLYNYKFYSDISIFSYNNFISLISSYCINGNCNSDEDPHYASFIIFSYGNSSDYNFNIFDYLSQSDENLNDLCFSLKNKTNIENNIFGLILYGIKILNFSDDIKLNSCLNNKIIEKNYILEKDELFSILFDKINKEKYVIEFAPVLIDPNYEDMLTYIIDSDSLEEKSEYNNNKKKYIGKTSYFTIFGVDKISNNCNELCDLCMNINKTKCISCKYTGYIDIINNEKICFPFYCSNDIILDGKCHEDIYSEQIDNVYNILKGKISNGEFQNKSNFLVYTNNVIFQVSSYELQKVSNLLNVSSVDLGNCEKKLKDKEGLSEEDILTIIKIDIKNKTYLSTYVQYEIYNPDGSKHLNLDICENIIIINVPTYLDSKIGNLYDHLNESGYNLFDPHDSFYNDICSIYTSEQKTDVSLSDRQKYIYYNNSFCQDNCQFEFFNSSNYKASCKCPAQEDLIKTDIDLIDFCFFRNEMFESFYFTLFNSNFRILKCYKLVFSINGLITNIGSYILISIIIIILILMIIYYLCDRKHINIYIKMILDKKSKSKGESPSIFNFSSNEKKKKITKTKQKKGGKKKISTNTKKLIHFSNNIVVYNEGKIKSGSFHQKKKSPNIYNKRNKGLVINDSLFNINKENCHISNSKNPMITEINYSRINKSHIKGDSHISNNKDPLISENNFIRSNKRHRTVITHNKDIIKRGKERSKTIKVTKKLNLNLYEKKNNNYEILNDSELNGLEYELAIKLDKRTYLQYYFSLLRKKQIFLFTFFSSKDYNLITIKLSLFLIFLSMYCVINALFFNDKTMHKIYINNGSFDIDNEIPQILISTLISFIINALLKKLSLSEPKLLELKKEEDIKKAIIKGKNLEKYFIFQFTLFFILTFVFMSFFWYYISCFCAVYKNTQIILIKDSLISFGISNLYPFMINLLPGIFRIHALRYPELKRIKLYKFSLLVALL